MVYITLHMTGMGPGTGSSSSVPADSPPASLSAVLLLLLVSSLPLRVQAPAFL